MRGDRVARPNNEMCFWEERNNVPTRTHAQLKYGVSRNGRIVGTDATDAICINIRLKLRNRFSTTIQGRGHWDHDDCNVYDHGRYIW